MTVGGRSEHTRVLVVTEGEKTEKQYVERLHQTLRDGPVAVAVKTVGLGDGPHAVVKKCRELRDNAEKAGKGYDFAVCVVDVDSHDSLQDSLGAADDSGIYVIVSNLKFEVWLLWHVADVRGARTSKQLDELMSKHELLRGKHLAPKFPIAKVGNAVEIASKQHPNLRVGLVGGDPSSTMTFLVNLFKTGKA